MNTRYCRYCGESEISFRGITDSGGELVESYFCYVCDMYIEGCDVFSTEEAEDETPGDTEEYLP